ncbi:SRAP domain-containing protein, putative [Plasmodium malariae]|uniref:SRAP domain-containing protein, putative n=1 Tax=Plasmodium malariae TaxID=5858 RepID=A0A1D3TC80_PLAMA|nr:SRAP domain-containing protein, putative [Plasmodium malariae]SCP02477.1 SRAP domain-containing protein, putative [Plasmodium malariae]
MCARIHYNIDLNVLKNKYNCKKVVNDDKKNYIPIIFESIEKSIADEEKSPQKIKIIQVCLWGINPFTYGKFDKDIALINARLETLHEKKSFNVLINKNRCAVIVNGYFEWISSESSTKKVPYYIFNGKSQSKTPPTVKDEEVGDKVKKEEKEEKEDLAQNIKTEVKNDEEVRSNEDTIESIYNNSHKRKKVVKEESATKKIKTELSSEAEHEETHSFIILAGLYSISNKDKSDCRNTIITTSSENTNLKDIHERCPLLLSENSLYLWLDTEKNYSDIIEKIKEEHIEVCNNLKYREVQNWKDYSNYQKEEKDDSILKYMKK